MWSEKEIAFLKENYPTKGGEYCSNILNRSVRSVKSKASRLGIKLSQKLISEINSQKVLKNQMSRSNDSFKVNPNKFYDIKDPEVSYYLGLFWADGYLHKNGLNIFCASEDISEIESVLNTIGDWSYYHRPPRKESWKSITRVYTHNSRVSSFMNENDFSKKSIMSPKKIISKIPEELRHYFFRGLVDGDGCFYFNEKNGKIKNRQFSITSSYEQDWSYVSDLFDSLNINYSIRRVKKKSSYSQIRVTKKKDIQVIGDYMYSGELFGFPRKLNKFNKLVK